MMMCQAHREHNAEQKCLKDLADTLAEVLEPPFQDSSVLISLSND